MSVFITGITGFIGSNLAEKLVEKGYDVYGMVRHVSRSELDRLERVIEKIHLVEGDITEHHSVRSAIASTAPNVVIHLAALSPVRYSFDNPFPYAKINYEGTMNFAHAILDEAPKIRLIVASTAEVYGWQPSKPISENAKLNPSSPYAVSKAAADLYLQMAMKVYGLKATVMRCNNTYGRSGEKGFLAEYIATSMLKNQSVYIGTPNHVRDYMYVDDHVDAYVRALENDSAVGQVYNVSPGNPVTNAELAKKIAEIIGFKGKILEGSYPPGYPTRPAGWDTEYIVLDSTRIRKQLDWKPNVSLDHGLQLAIEGFTKH